MNLPAHWANLLIRPESSAQTVCAGCGQWFTRTDPRRRYCSDDCRYKAKVRQAVQRYHERKQSGK